VILCGLALLGLIVAAGPADAQSTRHERRESNANRKRRIERTVNETYSQRYEVGGGGGFQRFRSGQYQQQDNQISFWASTLYSLNPKLGIQGEVRGGYGNAKLTNPLPSNNFLGYNPKISEYSFMAGPSYRFIRKEKVAVSAFVEGGYGLGKFDGDSKGLSASDIGVWTGNSGAAFSAGVHVDYNLFPNLAVRVSPSYLGTTYGGTLQNNKSVNVGLLYRFGKTQ
jgi:hypothetical protein